MSLRALLSALAVSTTLAAISAPAHAELELSGYGGMNWNFSSKVDLSKGGTTDSRTVDWNGKSFQMPPYWGARGTYWFKPQTSWGVAFDYTHAKAYADIDFSADTTYDHLEFTDGNNIFTLNAMYRVKHPESRWSYYGGVGAGVAVPHTEVELDAFPSEKTREYQLTGLAAQVLAGAQYRFAQNWGVFGEGKLSYTHDDSDLVGGGTLKTDIWSPHAILGLSYHF